MIVVKKSSNTIERDEETVEVFFPSRQLTAEEQLTVTSMLFNGVEYIYYQGDEGDNKRTVFVVSEQKGAKKTKTSFFSKLKAYICKILNIKTSNKTQNGKI